MTMVIESGMAIVVVQWFIKPEQEALFLRERKPVPPETPGFIGEALFRATVDAVEPAHVFLNIGYWRSRDDFFAKFEKAKPGQEPDLEEFELRPRRRHWLGPVHRGEGT